VGMIVAMMIVAMMIVFVRGTGHCKCIPFARRVVKRLYRPSLFWSLIAPKAYPR